MEKITVTVESTNGKRSRVEFSERCWFVRTGFCIDEIHGKIVRVIGGHEQITEEDDDLVFDEMGRS